MTASQHPVGPSQPSGTTDTAAVSADAAATSTDVVHAASEDATADLMDPETTGLLKEVATRMGGVSESDALRRSLRTMLALYDAKAQGGEPVVRYARTEQSVNLPGMS